jgi:hypothetical protein
MPSDDAASTALTAGPSVNWDILSPGSVGTSICSVLPAPREEVVERSVHYD